MKKENSGQLPLNNLRTSLNETLLIQRCPLLQRFIAFRNRYTKKYTNALVRGRTKCPL